MLSGTTESTLQTPTTRPSTRIGTAISDADPRHREPVARVRGDVLDQHLALLGVGGAGDPGAGQQAVEHQPLALRRDWHRSTPPRSRYTDGSRPAEGREVRGDRLARLDLGRRRGERVVQGGRVGDAARGPVASDRSSRSATG